MNDRAAPDWERIETVLLDMDGTLLDLGFDNRFWKQLVPRHYAALHRMSPAEAWEAIRPAWEATHGTLDWYCIEYWSRELGLDIAALTRAVRHEISWLPGARDFVARLRASGRRVVLVTNAHPETLAIKDAQVGVRREFHSVVSSHELGEPKECPDFWTLLAGHEPYEPARTLFVDDSLPVLRAARGRGIGWLCAVRRPDRAGPGRGTEDFPAVDSVGELKDGL